MEHFSIGKDLVPQEMVHAYAIVKKACANVNHRENRLTNQQFHLIVQVCDEILAGKHADMFPLHVWMTGSGTQFNMNVNEVIANRCSQIAGEPLGSKRPVHSNDHVNMAQSSNDTFPTAMHVAVATMVKKRLMPALDALRASVDEKAVRWKDVIKIGRTHLQDAVPTPVIGYDKASKIAHYASDHDLTLKEATLKLGYLSPSEFDRIVDPRKMLTTYVAK
nr:lyase family protein [Acetobacter fallax]